ncbi:MAG TPA: class I SAM-dependent methyltransferase [Candidatus Bathyarchaeia archaeon]|nr:class I SAM-dependent methyltransferase [Candidatus Bathyarchaeia archaeon]
MRRKDNARDNVLNASRAYYAHWAYYADLWAQRDPQATKTVKRELDFLEFAFRTCATFPIEDVLDVACGNGPHIVGLAKRGYRCTGQDYTPERVQMARARAERERISVKLMQGDATRLSYENEFDAALALNILFLLPNDDDVANCLRQINRALRSGGILICNIGNPFYEGEGWYSPKGINQGHYVHEAHARGMRYLDIGRLRDFDRVLGVAWWQETSVIEAPDGVHVFRDRERLRLLNYWDILRYLQEAGFKEIKCYPDWKVEQQRKPKAEELVFVSRKD